MGDTVPPASDPARTLCGLYMTCWLRQPQKVPRMYCQTLSGCMAALRFGVHYLLREDQRLGDCIPRSVEALNF